MKRIIKNHELLGILILTIIGAFLRFYNLNWDGGHFFPPDERNIAAAVSRIHFFDQLNPGFFAYGGFLIYLYRITGELLVFLTKNQAWIYDWAYINLIGRFYSALFSTLMIPVVFFLTKNIFSKNIAILSTVFAAFTVSFIQTAHFAVTESAITFFALIICFFSVRMLKQSLLVNYMLTGGILGVAAATKITTLSFLIFPLTAYIRILGKKTSHHFKQTFFLFLLVIMGALVFTLFSPYTFLNWNKFMESMRYESGVATGRLQVVYTFQFINTQPYLFQIKNFLWQMGPVGILAVPAFLLLLFETIKTKNPKLSLFLSLPFIYFLYVGSWHAKFIRFMMPILPVIIIAISYFLFVIAKRKAIGQGFLIFSVITTILWAFTFFSIYTKEQTRISASRWIYTNIPSGSKLLGEHWDDGLPVPLTSIGDSSKYHIEQLTIYEPDNQQKINYYAEKLSAANYIIINSRRLYGTLMYLPEKYPITSKYYQLLFGGKLGYEKVAEFTSYPSIFGVEINDDTSEETFQVYDHPKVIIFNNAKNFSQENLKKALIKGM